MHSPAPSHQSGFVCTPFVHESAFPHDVPAGYFWHAPAPSHMPLELPHVPGSSTSQSSCGSIPCVAGPHTPSSPSSWSAAEQAIHVPVHAVSQQNPSTHEPLVQSEGTLHTVPSTHVEVHTGPPQSSPVSALFFTPSVQLGRQNDPEHASPTQSSSTSQSSPGAHVAPQTPPQSTSVSSAFFTRSEHVGARHFFVVMEQTPLTQSPASWQVSFVRHVAPQTPPQSVSVSSEFLTPSAHSGGAQTPRTVHTLLVQSPGPRHSAHTPLPSHLMPPPSSHDWPAGVGLFFGAPFSHVSTVHCLPSSRTSSASATLFVAPLPSHWIS